MTRQDYARFSAALTALSEFFDKPVTATMADLYFRAASGLSIDDFEKAAALALDRCKFFPRPVELRELLEGSTDEKGARAWTTFFEAVRRNRPGLLSDIEQETVRLTFGSFQQARNILPSGEGDTGPMLLGLRKQFLANFASAKRQEAAGALTAGEARTALSGLVSELKRRGLPAGNQAARVSLPRQAELATSARGAAE
jgi:hypothetical protein